MRSCKSFKVGLGDGFMKLSERREAIVGIAKLFIALICISVFCIYLWGLAVAGCVFLMGFLYLLVLCNVNYIEFDFTDAGFSYKNLFGKQKLYTWDSLELVYTDEQVVSISLKKTHEDLIVLSDSDEVKLLEDFLEGSMVNVGVIKC